MTHQTTPVVLKITWLKQTNSSPVNSSLSRKTKHTFKAKKGKDRCCNRQVSFAKPVTTHLYPLGFSCTKEVQILYCGSAERVTPINNLTDEIRFSHKTQKLKAKRETWLNLCIIQESARAPYLPQFFLLPELDHLELWLQSSMFWDRMDRTHWPSIRFLGPPYFQLLPTDLEKWPGSKSAVT